MRARLFLRYWLPAIVWMAVIFIGSTDLMSAEQTARIIAPLLRWLKPNISAGAIAQIQLIVRKGAHVSEYAILTVLLWRALRITVPQTNMSILALIVLLVSAVFALSDEFHQSFTAARTASAVDVMIDICGALITVAFCWILSARVANRKSRIDSRKLKE
jgi:VanZ family protein